MDTINLRNYTLEQVENFRDSGVITADQWEGYAHAWRTGAPRFSSELSAYGAHEFTTEGAREVAETLGCCKVRPAAFPAYATRGCDCAEDDAPTFLPKPLTGPAYR